MRKLLLASVAVLGASMGMAETANAQDAISLDNSGQSFPTPGTVTVRLNGRFRAYGGVIDQNQARTSNFAVGAAQATASTQNAAGQNIASTTTFNQGLNKVSNYGAFTYARLYPGFDGVATNGLKYGASLEIRQDNNFGAGGGVANGSVTGSNRTRDLLYFRRQWGYLGTDKFGQIRIGAADNPASLFLTGSFENFNDGGLNGDLPGFLPGNLALAWPFADVGNIYATTKIVYLSPQFFGVDFGLSYEPTTGAGGGDNGAGCGPSPAFGTVANGGNGVATPGCDFLSSTSTADYARRKNTYEGLVRYRGTFGPVGLAATASYTGSGRVLDSGVVGSATNPARYRLEDLSVFDFGLAATFSGFSVGGNYQFGRYNVPGGGGYGGLLAKGQPNSSAFVVGASYTVGPVIVGAHYLRSYSQGDQTTATNRNSIGVPVRCGRCDRVGWPARGTGCGRWCDLLPRAGLVAVRLLSLDGAQAERL